MSNLPLFSVQKVRVDSNPQVVHVPTGIFAVAGSTFRRDALDLRDLPGLPTTNRLKN